MAGEARDQHRWWIGGALCALALLLYAVGGETRLVTHVALAQLCHGISGGKIFFFLGFTALCCARLALAKTPPRSDARGTGLLFPALVVGLAMAMLSYVWYTSALRLPRDTPTYHWLHGLNSVNSFTHTHTSKAILAHAVSWLGWEELRTRFDTGAPYAMVVPVWVSVVAGAAFVIALVESVRVLPNIASRYSPPLRAWALCAWILASSGVVKCILDGGPAAYDAVVGLIALVALARQRPVRSLVVPTIFVLAAWMTAIALVSPGALASQCVMGVYRGAMLIFLIACGGAVGRVGRWMRPATIATCSLVIAIVATREFATWLVPLLQPARSRAIQRDPASLAWRSVATNPSESFARASLRLGENPLRVRRIAFPRSDSATSSIYALLLARDGSPAPGASALAQLHLAPRESVAIAKFEPAPGEHAPGAWYVEARFPPPFAPMLLPARRRGAPLLERWLLERGGGAQHENERFAAYHALDDALRAAGLEEYVLVPYVFASRDDDDDAERETP